MNTTAWLAALAMVAAVNPPRVAEMAAGLGRTTPTRPGATAVAVVGTAGSTGLFLVLAVVASALLDAIDVSPPTLLVGVGLVLMIGAVKDLLVGAPASEPALSGWGSAVVPVAIPAVARPQVGLLALAAGGHYGLLPLVVGAVTLVVSVGVLTWWASGREPLRFRVLRWGAVLASVLTAGAGAVLAVEGVFAV